MSAPPQPHEVLTDNNTNNKYTMAKVIETIADAIAVEILNENTIITGKGNELHLFTKYEDDKENVFKWQEQKLDINLTNKIHGIHKSDTGILLVYGEKEFILLRPEGRQQEFREFFRATLSDWISCGAFMRDSQEFILLTAHSIILRFDYDVTKETCTCSLRERISCTDKSTLYCAHLHGSSWANIVVFAGNAFGELLIWQPSRNEQNSEGSVKPNVAPLIHRISAHNGVIFSIDYDEDSKQLITTSDDRAVKWWRVAFPKESKMEWMNSSMQPVASGYGHVARVFKGRIIKNESDIYALSAGEDSYFCLWRNNGELLFKRRQQFGATIWNFVYDSHSQTIYTIGSMGDMVAYDLSYVLKESQTSNDGFHLLPEVNLKNTNEYIAKVKFLNEQEIMGITNENHLMRLLRDSGKNGFHPEVNGQWERLNTDLDFKCTVMEVFDNRIAICGFKRLILLEWRHECGTFEKLIDQHLLEGVIRAFVFFSPEDFLVCDDKGNCLLHLESQQIERSLKLAKCKEPWLTASLLLYKGKFLLISNRLGNLLLYKLSTEEPLHYILCDTIKHPHGNLGATQLQILNETNEEALVRSSGHDGAIKVFSIDYAEAKIKSCCREIVAVSWIENVYSWFKKQDLFLGFNDNHFVAWSREYDFLIQLACGGGHRCWHFSINPIDYHISLVFIKNKRVRFYRLPLINKGLISFPPPKKWHISPTNIMQTIKGVSNNPIAVSAGDDNLIKIHSITDKGLVQHKELHCHISNIRALKLISLNEQEFIIFSGGGRAQLCVTKVNKQNFQVEELIHYTLKQECNNKSNQQQNKEEYNFDPETRLMSLDIREMGNQEYQLFIGCSDGHIRSLELNLTTLHIKPLMQYFYNKCILHIKYIPEYNYVLAAGTDGLIKFFDSSLTNCLGKLKHHSSGINGLSVMFDTERKTLKILSGGDDQAVSFSEIDLNQGFEVLHNFSEPSLHTAQVCAAAICSNGDYGYTSGVDQLLYKIDLTAGQVVDSFHSCVADIKGVCLPNDDLFLLYGCGLQMLRF